MGPRRGGPKDYWALGLVELFKVCLVILVGPWTGGSKDYWTLGLVVAYSNFYKRILGLVILGLVDPRTLVDPAGLVDLSTEEPHIDALLPIYIAVFLCIKKPETENPKY